ncbi:hypothetical protein [Pseudoduganella violaceinigra]|uniref:hypothetical protein n=1 Tax=Pseudoduganella violaceinigra TaxID=246602 RepID=UPI0012B543DB|nr:hypothetical protein [Pseudoduganella violaceinigra]
MNRLPPMLPGRWLDDLLPTRSNPRPWSHAAWRAPGSVPAQASPAHPSPRQARMQGKPAPPSQPDTAASRSGPAPAREQPEAWRDGWRPGEDDSGGGQHGGEGESGQGEEGPAAAGGAPASCDTCEAQEVAALLPAGDCSGIFEVRLPNGQVMGVAVDSGPASVSYHLKPAGRELAGRLRGQQRELTAHLERRIGKDVILTIL